LKAALAVVCPVPPLAIASVPVKFCAWTSKKFVPSDHTIILLPAAIAIPVPAAVVLPMTVEL